MTHRNGSLALLTLGLLLAGAAPLHAQAQGMAKASTPADVQLADLKTMKDKFVSLGGAFPADKFDWMPMEGVRSVREVLMLIASEGDAFPVQWGAPRVPGTLEDRNQEQARLRSLDKTALLAEVAKAYDNMIGFVSKLDAAGRAKQVRFFGQPVTVEGAVQMAANDQHEHLGQLIAYARTNRIVPPWTAAAGGR